MTLRFTRTQSIFQWATRCGGPGPAADTASPAALLARPIRNIVPLTTRSASPGSSSNQGSVYTHTFSRGWHLFLPLLAHCRSWHDWRGQCFGWLRTVGMVGGSDLPSVGCPPGWRLFPGQREVLRHGRTQSPTQLAASSLIRLNMIRSPILGLPSPPPIPTPMRTTWLAACSLTLERLTSTVWAVRKLPSPDTAGRVFRYDPVADVISPVAAPWPAVAGTTSARWLHGLQ